MNAHSQYSGPARTAADYAVEATDLSKIVDDPAGRLMILDHINVAIAPGRTLAISGASGSGKSTLLGLLAGLDLPTHGTVRLFGQPLAELDEDGRARLRAAFIGFVFQSFQLLPHLSALDNVILPLDIAAGAGRQEAPRERRRRAMELLDRVGLGGRMFHTPRTLSGGEQQRVALARAFVVRPRILFADEPTGSLDSATGEAVIELMFELNRESGSALLVVTHDRQVADRCERRIELKAGRLVADEAQG